jgi:predicted RNase H-like nuclease (RuvC/YqgF family)
MPLPIAVGAALPFLRKNWKWALIGTLICALAVQNKCSNNRLDKLHAKYSKQISKLIVERDVAKENYAAEKKAGEEMEKSVKAVATALIEAKEEGDRLRAEANELRRKRDIERSRFNGELSALRSEIAAATPVEDQCEVYVPAAVLMLRDMFRRNQ